MSTSNRAARLTKTHRILKKHYKLVSPAERPVLEHLLFACCLECATHEAADEAFAKLQEAYFDWNEVRVTTVTELAEIMTCLPDPSGAASRLKRTLQAVFEGYYSFDIEFLKKENIGQAVKKLDKLDGVSRYAIAYVTQNGLAGHAIAVSTGALAALRIVGVISEQEARAHRVPGMERAIPKSKGVEFAALLHQLGADYAASPFSSRVRGVLLEIDPDAKARFPKRARRKKTEESSASPEPEKTPRSTRQSEAKKTPSQESKQVKEKTPAKKKIERTKKAKKKSTPSGESSVVAKKKSTNKRLSQKKPR